MEKKVFKKTWIGIVISIVILIILLMWYFNESKDFTFVDTEFEDGSKYGAPGPKVGLLFKDDHGLKEGDKIKVDKTDKKLNPSYDGKHKVLKVLDTKRVVTDIEWGQNSNNESGLVRSYKFW